MSTSDFYYYFQHSSIVQWVLDGCLLQRCLLKNNIQTAVQLEAWLNNSPEQAQQLRDALHVLHANQAAKDFYRCDTLLAMEDFFKKQVDSQQLTHLAIALLNIKTVNTRYSYQAKISSVRGDKVLLVTCDVPAVADIAHGMNVTVMDITLLSEAESEFQEREQFVSALLKAIPDILLVFDFQQQRTIFQNVDLVEHLGYSLEDMAETDNQLMSYIIHPDDGMGHDAMAQIYQVLMRGEIYELTIRLQHANGEWRHYYFRSAALDKDEQGQLRTAIVVARDITGVLKTRQILSAQQKRYQLLADNFTDVIVITDLDLQLIYVSPSIGMCLGYDAESFVLDETALTRLGLAGDIPTLREMLAQSPSQNIGQADYEHLIERDAQTAGGVFFPVEIAISSLRDEYGLLDGLLFIVRDISERLKNETNNRLAAKVFSNSLDGIYITDSTGVIIQANTAFYTITGFVEEDVIGKKPAQLSSGWKDIDFHKDIVPVIEKYGGWSGEIMSRRANGEAFLTWMSISEVRDSREQLISIITSFRDITEAKSSEESIRKLAYYDPLTKLPNRQLFIDRLSQALQHANRNRHYVVLLFLDLDGFKAVNDEYGHAVGDKLLTKVAGRLRECVRSDDTVARMGGDEFTVILGMLPNKESAENATMQVAKKIIAQINRPFVLDGYEIHIGTSIGIALYPDDAFVDDELIKLADTAMYHAKNQGKNNYQFYTQDMHERAKKRLQMEKSITHALQNNEFTLVYLPKYALNEKQLINCEALLRWQHPTQGLLTPAHFLHTLEELGLGAQVGFWVLEMACQQMQKNAQLNIAINIFSKHYADGDLAAQCRRLLTQYQIEASRLTLEISEKLVMKDTGFAFAQISELKALGIRVSLDDFASGMLSIAYLHRLPIDEVKIDRLLIATIDTDQQQYQFIQAVVTLAKNLGLCVIAEGIERSTQLACLQAMACDQGQGFLFAQPMFIEQLVL